MRAHRKLLLGTLALFGAMASGAEYRVIKVETGDRVEIEDDKKQRQWVFLVGVAAPRPHQDFFSRSMNRLRFFVEKKRVDVQWITPQGRCLAEITDRCFRAAKVIVHGADIGLKQISDGSAWVHRQSAADQSTTDRALYTDAENRAQREKRGLWNGFNPIAPWLFTPPPEPPRRVSSTKTSKRKTKSPQHTEKKSKPGS